MMKEYYHIDLSQVQLHEIREIICRWRKSVTGLDNLIYEDARREFELSDMIDFDSDPFVASVREHIQVKTELTDEALKLLEI